MNPYKSPQSTGEYNKYHDPIWYVQTFLKITLVIVICLIMLPFALVLVVLIMIGGLCWFAFAPFHSNLREDWLTSLLIWLSITVLSIIYYDLEYNNCRFIRPALAPLARRFVNGS